MGSKLAPQRLTQPCPQAWPSPSSRTGEPLCRQVGARGRVEGPPGTPRHEERWGQNNQALGKAGLTPSPPLPRRPKGALQPMIPASWVRKGPAGHPSVGWQLGEGCALAPLPEGADSAHSTPLQSPRHVYSPAGGQGSRRPQPSLHFQAAPGRTEWWVSGGSDRARGPLGGGGGVTASVAQRLVLNSPT